MKQNKGRSFASLAKSLDTRYSNRKNDRMLEQEYHNEMQKLVQQQEAARAQMGLTNDNGQDRMMPQQFPNGGWLSNLVDDYKSRQRVPAIQNNSGQLNVHNSPVKESQLPWRQETVNYEIPQTISNMAPFKIDPNTKPVLDIPIGQKIIKQNIIPSDNSIKSENVSGKDSAYWDKMAKDANPNMDIPIVSSNVGKWDSLKPELPSGQMDIASYEAPGYTNNPPTLTTQPIAGVGDVVNKGVIPPTSDKSDLTNSYISAGATALNNILQGVLTKKPKSIAAPSYTPKELDLSDRVLEAKRQAELSGNIARNQARNLGLNAGATIANQAGAQSGIDRNLAGALTDINLAEQQYNVGEQNKAGMFNAEAKYKNDLINQQLKDQYDQKMLDSLSGAIGTIPELMTDVNKIKYQDKVLAGLDTKEKNIIKLLSSGKFKYDSDEFKIMYDSLSDNAKKQITK